MITDILIKGTRLGTRERIGTGPDKFEPLSPLVKMSAPGKVWACQPGSMMSVHRSRAELISASSNRRE
jgi:hypothetical protein